MSDLFGTSFTPYLIFFGIIVIFMGIKIVRPKKANVVLFLGKIVRVQREGLNFTIPFFERTVTQSLYMVNLPVSVDGITKDNVTTSFKLNVIYKVKDDSAAIIKSLFSIDNPVLAIRSLVEEQLRAKIFEFQHEEIFSKREEIGSEIKEILEEKLSEFGMELNSVQVIDIMLDADVMIAMNKIVSALKNKEATITAAQAEKTSSILNAEAEKEVKRLQGEGMALQREAIAKGFSNSIKEIKEMDTSLNGNIILNFLLDSSRIEVLEKVGKDNSKLIYLNENLEGRSTSMVGAATKML